MKNYKILLIGFSAFAILGIGFFLFLYFEIDGTFIGRNYSKEDLITNYQNQIKEINEAVTYYKSILPENYSTSIEFKNDNSLAMIHLYRDSIVDNNWNLEMGTPKIDSILTVLNWTDRELHTLREKLKQANCRSIGGNIDRVSVGWQRSGMGILSYEIYQQTLTQEQIDLFHNECDYVYYKDNIFLAYESSLAGNHCFPEYYKERDKTQGVQSK